MKLAIATDWFAPRTGGIESQLSELATRLVLRGHSVTVITGTPGPSDTRPFSVHRLDALRLPGLDVMISPRLPRLLATALAEFDLVHAHVSVISPVGYAASLIAHAHGIPVVATFHSVLRHKRHLLRVADALAGVGRSGIVWSAVSRSVAAQASSALGTNVAVLPNGVDLAFWQPTGNMTRSDREIVFVTSMRLHRKKRPVALLRALARASRGVRRPIRLVVAGDGPARGSVERETQSLRSAGVSVDLVGWMDRDQLRALYHRADAFVSASRRESFGIAALEARAAGAPVIAMREAGSSDFLEHEINALLCDDDDDLATQVRRIIDDENLRARLGQCPAAIDRFDWQNVLDAHAAAYARAMASRARAAVVAG
ncbi:MAG TPA: glycosyltransferase [Gemmatimonadaceae bacterium]|nr:glycosyltransferase [Gemmatimonadaceae bacterium]